MNSFPHAVHTGMQGTGPRCFAILTERFVMSFPYEESASDVRLSTSGLGCMVTEPKSCDAQGNAGRFRASTRIHRFSDLRWWWNRSIVRIAAGECCNSPRRILTILRRKSLASVGVPSPDCLLDRDLESFCLLNSFWPACTRGIQHQRKLHPYMGALEAEMFREAFQLGATWGWNNSYNGKHNEQLHPS